MFDKKDYERDIENAEEAEIETISAEVFDAMKAAAEERAGLLDQTYSPLEIVWIEHRGFRKGLHHGMVIGAAFGFILLGAILYGAGAC